MKLCHELCYASSFAETLYTGAEIWAQKGFKLVGGHHVQQALGVGNWRLTSAEMLPVL